MSAISGVTPARRSAPVLLALTMGLLAPTAIAAPPTSAPMASHVHVFSIPPQPLSGAIEAFAIATGVQVLYDRPMGPEPPSPGFRGQASDAEALAGLLAGTGLKARFTDARDVLLEPIGTKPPPIGQPPPDLPSGPALSLEPLEVESPPMIEGPAAGGFNQRLYRSQIESRVHRALARNSSTARGVYAATVQLWIAPSGLVRRIVIAVSTGDPERDRAIERALGDVQLDGPAPRDMPQPVSVRIQVQATDR